MTNLTWRRALACVGWSLTFGINGQRVTWPDARWERILGYFQVLVVVPPLAAATLLWFGPVGWVLRKTYLKARIQRYIFLQYQAKLYELGAPILGTPFWQETDDGFCYTTLEDWAAAQALAGILGRGPSDEDVGYS